MRLTKNPSLPTAIRWTARVTGLLVFLFWGAFFVEHITEWFSDFSHLPPAKVVLGQILHGLMLAGFIVAWIWELPGALMILVFATLFFLGIIGWSALVFLFITIIPAILYITAWKMSRKNTETNQ